jgi:murein DD-endopeptidase MepM/ murein hydrolase activator NlpD
MVFAPDDSSLQQLLQETTELFGGKQKFVNPRSPETPTSTPSLNTAFEKIMGGGNIQSPIKGTFYNSGTFSLQPTDKRHPKGHMGVDMRAAAGTPIYPLTPGVVTNVGTDPVGGNVVNIQHANGLRTYYAHCGTVKVHKGDKVDNDTVIATVGDTGNAKGTVPHLHFQVWQDGQIQNPEKYFTMPKYTNYDTKKEKWWLSDDAKQDATSFSMKQHVSDNRVAFSKDVQKLVKIAEAYYKLSTDYR